MSKKKQNSISQNIEVVSLSKQNTWNYKTNIVQIQCKFPIHPHQAEPLQGLPYCTKEIIYFTSHAFNEYAALHQDTEEMDIEEDKENVEPAEK